MKHSSTIKFSLTKQKGRVFLLIIPEVTYRSLGIYRVTCKTTRYNPQFYQVGVFFLKFFLEKSLHLFFISSGIFVKYFAKILNSLKLQKQRRKELQGNNFLVIGLKENFFNLKILFLINAETSNIPNISQAVLTNVRKHIWVSFANRKFVESSFCFKLVFAETKCLSRIETCQSCLFASRIVPSPVRCSENE